MCILAMKTAHNTFQLKILFCTDNILYCSKGENSLSRYLSVLSVVVGLHCSDVQHENNLNDSTIVPTNVSFPIFKHALRTEIQRFNISTYIFFALELTESIFDTKEMTAEKPRMQF